jgi:hypothetical protein
MCHASEPRSEILLQYFRIHWSTPCKTDPAGNTDGKMLDQLVTFSSITVKQILMFDLLTNQLQWIQTFSLKIRFQHVCPKSPVPSGITINSLSHQARKMKTQFATTTQIKCEDFPWRIHQVREMKTQFTTINKSNVKTSHGESLLWFITCFTHICKLVTQGVGPQGTKVHMLAA